MGPSPSPSNPERSGLIISGILFVGSVTWMLRRIKIDAKNRFKNGSFASSGDVDAPPHGQVGRRGIASLHPPLPYLGSFLKCLEDPCDAKSRKQGHIALCVAENKLMTEILAERMMQQSTIMSAFSDSVVYCYNSFLGIPVARQAFAYFFARRFLFPDLSVPLSPEEAFKNINPNHIGLGSGAASILNSIFFLIGEKGDACLIPAPYYAAFENDMSLVAGIVPFPFRQANPAAGPTESELDLAFMEAKSQGLNPRFLLLTNPHNPLGVIYTPSTLTNAVSWARKRQCHTIVDEIYALSVRGSGFQSIIQVLGNQLGDDVHCVWAVSKDFGASGLRVGAVYSQNKLFMEGLGNLNIFSGISGPIQLIIAELLTDDDFVLSYLAESRNQLQQNYSICVSKLEEMVLPYIPADAGLFVYVDFSSLLPEKTSEWEDRLGQLMFEHARIVLTPGDSQRDPTPGMFRICYAWVEPDVLSIAMERLSRLVAKIRRLNWDDLNASTLNIL